MCVDKILGWNPRTWTLVPHPSINVGLKRSVRFLGPQYFDLLNFSGVAMV